MKTVQHLLAASALTSLASSSAVARREYDDITRRATNQAPNGYAPAKVDCPSTRPSIRVANGLSNEETEWLKKRRPNTIQPMKDLLGRLDFEGFDAAGYINKLGENTTALPNVAIAFSGGGYRAMTNGAGNLAAFDSRTSGSTEKGHIGGLLQSATYIAGLSGGGWLVGSIYANNFTSVQNTISHNEDGAVWQLGNSILKGPKTGGIQLLSTVDYYKNIYDAAAAKENAGFNFNLSLTDYWGRALSFQLVNATDGGPGFTFSSIQDDEDFKNGNAPMPILLADERAPGETIISLNTTNVEFNPFEMGSFDPTLYGFAPLKYLGSNFSEGRLPDNEPCIAGFDNIGFIMGTSSSLFNQFILQLDGQDSVPKFLKDALTGILSTIGDGSNDIADYTPNPFLDYNNRSNPSAEGERLTLVDGGEDGQNIPFNPLIQPIRAVDVIFAVDSSADTVPDSAANWPNGTSLVATYQRSTNATIQNGTAFPAIPDQNTFVNLGLNNRPTFFGCDAQNATTDAGTAPLIVYIPNSPYVYNSNVSTFQMEYNNTERNAIIENGYNVATQGNSTRDDKWSTCVGCAVLSRSFIRNNQDVPSVCQQCFDRYCWNGTVSSEKPAPYFPQLVGKAINVQSSSGKSTPSLICWGVAAFITSYFTMC
ncbi:hypothetical protein BU24DRAFT_438242 [Aaosphaeria arxii CBS 175.79]|uniref:Lysophospholipase n=1 Tax=Aaosphaeria arxii CBS 175.79 TaxID=1450172 RepID=A0A6A5Y6E6_9PLEO|nr:uncharacterized protein BU24DRAFT_438242 [Aaosphaeria arxii CBS 175.79]KAF2020866.1 hypothetical protein BU24DRAFT_438242 [Aaosphaeria arxii CBS 175.79]